MNTKKENVAAADGIRRPLVRRMRKFGILLAMGLVAATALLGADCVVNSFVTVEGEGARAAADGSIHFANATGPVSVEVTARPGWKVEGRPSLSTVHFPGGSETLRVTSDLGEDSGSVSLEDCQFGSTVTNEHKAPPGVKVNAPKRLALLYALPETNILVSAAASCETLSNGLHEVTTTWLPCGLCGATHDPTNKVDSVSVEPGEKSWTASFAGASTNDSVWTGYMAKGVGQIVKFAVVATNECCTNCICRSGGDTTVDVHELSVQREDYVGLNRTDAGRDNPLANARLATALIDPEPSGIVSYSWTDCGICTFVGPTDQQTVRYYAPDLDKASGAPLVEQLTVTATITDGDQTASATCTTNFTVVKVDILLPGVAEEDDETKLPAVEFVPDNDDGSLSKTGLRSLFPFSVTCEPDDVPGVVNVAIDVGTELYEITESLNGKPVKARPAKKSYPCSEIGSVCFGIHGHSLFEGESERNVLIAAGHPKSGAIDEARVKVVPPPPLEVSVKFDSPADGGGWPYDPVWDDPEWAPTVNGILAKQCAEDTDEALVIYALSRDASKVEGSIYKSIPLWLDDEVEKLRGMDPSEGVHTNSWDIGPTRKTDVYYAEVVAIEKETGKPRKAESNHGEVVRDDYCFSSNAQEQDSFLAGNAASNSITKIDEVIDGTKRWATATILIAGTVIFVNKYAAALAAEGATVVSVVAKNTGAAELLAEWYLTVWYNLTTVPNWLKKDVVYLRRSWNVVRMTWRDGKYEVALNSITQEPGPPAGSGKITERLGSFEMGAERYSMTGPTTDNPNATIILRQGYYSLEFVESSPASVFDPLNYYGYKLQAWSWSEKPYGLKEPAGLMENPVL